MARTASADTELQRRLRKPLRSKDFRAAFQSASGAIDLASIMVGVIVIGIIAGIIAAMVFAVIPWSQDQAAKQSLTAVRDAESVAYTQGSAGGTAKFLNKPGLIANELLQDSPRIGAATDPDGTCYVGISKSQTGRVFFVTEKGPDVKELTASVGPGCIDATTLADLIAGVGGPDDGAGGPAIPATADMTICEDPNTAWAVADPALLAALKDQLSVDQSATLLVSDAARLDKARARGEEITSLEGLQCATNAEYVDIDSTRVTNLTPVLSIANATELYISGNTELDAVTVSGAGFPNMEGIWITDNVGATSVTLTDLPNVTETYVTDNDGMSNFTFTDSASARSEVYVTDNFGATGPVNYFLSNLPGMDEIYLTDNQDVTTITLTNLPGVNNNIYVDESPRLTSFTAANLPNATELQVAENEALATVTLTDLPMLDFADFNDNAITDMSQFSSLTSVSRLNISNSPVADLTPLSSLNLTHLWASNTNVSSLAGLSGMADMSWLEVQDTNISSLAPVSGMGNLTYLEVSRTGVTTLVPLSGLSKLETVNANGAPVSSIAGLSGLPALTAVHLDGAAITNINALSTVQGLQSVDVSNTAVSSLEPLRNLMGLTTVVMVGSAVADLAPLQGHDALLYVNLLDTPVDNILALHGSPAIYYLGLPASVSDSEFAAFQASTGRSVYMARS